MLRDAVSRTANVERTRRHKWVKQAQKWRGNNLGVIYLFYFSILPIKKISRSKEAQSLYLLCRIHPHSRGLKYY